jgi:hypothetical protein
MIRWQYRIINLGESIPRTRVPKALAFSGAEGWELIDIYDRDTSVPSGMDKAYMMFKRPVPEGAQPEGGWSQTIEAAGISSVYEAFCGTEPAPATDA